MAKHNRLTSWEISQYLIELGRPATAREVAEGLKLKYPQYHSSLRNIYLRMRSIALSHNSDCVVDLSVRPRTFYLTRIDDAFFRRCRNRGLRANGTKTYVKEIIRCLYLNLELSALLLKYPLAV